MTIYIITDENHTIGFTGTIKEALILLIIDGWLHLNYHSNEQGLTLAEYLEIDKDTSEEFLIEMIKEMPKEKIKEILEEFGFTLQEEKIWYYGEYLHNKMWDT